jgi:very-short-patch-repair endonuclease
VPSEEQLSYPRAELGGMSADTVDELIAAAAAPQCGYFSWLQARDAGATGDVRRRRIASGRWRVTADAVYRLPGHADGFEASLWRAVLAMEGAVVSHEAAARLHCLATFAVCRAVVTVPHGRAREGGVAVVHQSRRLPPDHRCTLRGLPVSTVVRTIVDLAGVCSRSRLEYVLDDAVAQGRVAVRDVAVCLDTLCGRGRPGAKLLRGVLARRLPGRAPPESRLENLLSRVLRDGGLPEPVRQYPFPGRRLGEGRVDAAYPEARLVIEADGRRWHTRVDDFERDRRRDNQAVLAGWHVLRFTWEDLRTRPEQVQTTVRRVLDAYAA